MSLKRTGGSKQDLATTAETVIPRILRPSTTVRSLSTTTTCIMWSSKLALLAGIISLSQAQDQTTVSGTTYSDCHAHGATQYCYGPDGDETPFSAAETASITSAPASTTASTSTSTGQTTAVTSCHAHDSDTYCINGNGHEVLVSFEATPTGEAPAEYTDCHSHGDEQYCVGPDGGDVLVLAENGEADEHSHPLDESSSSEGQDCHFHAGVE